MGRRSRDNLALFTGGAAAAAAAAVTWSNWGRFRDGGAAATVHGHRERYRGRGAAATTTAEAALAGSSVRGRRGGGDVRYNRSGAA